jgi:hypothetical protein
MEHGRLPINKKQYLPWFADSDSLKRLLKESDQHSAKYEEI